MSEIVTKIPKVPKGAVTKEERRVAYNEYMKVWRANHQEQVQKEGRDKYYRTKLRKQMEVLKDIDYTKYEIEELETIYKYLVLIKEIKEKYPELLC